MMPPLPHQIMQHEIILVRMALTGCQFLFAENLLGLFLPVRSCEGDVCDVPQLPSIERITLSELWCPFDAASFSHFSPSSLFVIP